MATTVFAVNTSASPKTDLKGGGKFDHIQEWMGSALVLFSGGIPLRLLCVPMLNNMLFFAFMTCTAQQVPILPVVGAGAGRVAAGLWTANLRSLRVFLVLPSLPTQHWCVSHSLCLSAF